MIFRHFWMDIRIIELFYLVMTVYWPTRSQVRRAVQPSTNEIEETLYRLSYSFKISGFYFPHLHLHAKWQKKLHISCVLVLYVDAKSFCNTKSFCNANCNCIESFEQLMTFWPGPNWTLECICSDNFDSWVYQSWLW